MRLFFLFILALSFATSSASASTFGALGTRDLRARYTQKADGLESRLNEKLNEACVRAHLTGIEFQDIERFRPRVNYCELKTAELPQDVVALIEKIADLNKKVAALLGLPADEVFALDLQVVIRGNFLGSINSEAEDGRVLLSALPDWKYSDFPSEIYTHEVIHTLVFNDGVIADALLGVQDHPFLAEALPDLISMTLHRSPKIVAGEGDLPACLREVRDIRNSRGLNEPFRKFYTLASFDKVLGCCDTLDLEKGSPLAKVICSEYAWKKPGKLAAAEAFIPENEVETTPYDEPHLSAPFEAENCRVKTKTGLAFLDNCDKHQFTYPLVSFFFRLHELTGKSQVSAYFSKIREGSEEPAIYQCGYRRGTPTLGGTKAYVALRPLLRSFMALRESLSPADRGAFDLAWREQGLEKMVDLDRIYRTETLGGVAFFAVKAKNPVYRDANQCDNPYRFDPVACGVECKRVE